LKSDSITKKAGLIRKRSPEGLRFECQPGCTKCCAIPGIVFVHEREFQAMADFLKLSLADFKKTYIKKHWGELHQFNFPDAEPCSFLRPDGCSIYPVRPAQCRAFPFWPENMNKVETWINLKNVCPGIDKGKLYTVDEITDIMAEVSYGPFL